MGQQKIKAAVSSTVIAALLAGCGGGGQSTPAVPHSSSPTSVSYVVKVPASSAVAKAIRTRHYTSRDAKGIGLRGGQHGTVTFPNTASGVKDYATNPGYTYTLAPSHTYTSANTGNETCTGAGSDGSFTCTITIAGGQGGYIDAQIVLFDSAPTADGQTGTFTGNALSIGTMTDALVLTGQSNTFSFTLSGVVDSVQLQSNVTSFVVGTTASATLSAVAKDAAGDMIIGTDRYVDAGGNLLTLSMGASPNAHFTYTGGTTFNTPADTVPVHYDGVDPGATSESFSISTSVAGTKNAATVSVTKSASGGIGVPGNPTITSLTTGSDLQPDGIAADNSGNIWATYYGSTTLKEWTLGSPDAIGSTVTLPAGGNPGGITLAANGDMCVAIAGAVGKIGCFDPTAPSPISPTLTSALTHPPFSLTRGADGNIWFTENSFPGIVGVLTANGILTQYSDATHPFNYCAGIVTGPDGNMWVANNGDGTVTLINPITHAEAAHYIVSLGTNPTYLTVGPDGNVWVALNDVSPNNEVARVTPGGAVTLFPSGVAKPSGIAVGADGNIYVASNGADGKVAVIRPATGSVLKTFVPAGAGNNLLPVFANAIDGNVYVGNYSTGALDYFKP